MDRLAEFSRPAPTHRPEASEFARSRNARPDRRDEVETRTEERVSERERQERASEKPERFAQHLEEQKASIEPQATLEQPAEAEPPPVSEPKAEQPETETKVQPGQTPAVTQKPAGEAQDAELAPLLEQVAAEIPGATAAPAKVETQKLAAPVTPPPLSAPVLPVVASAPSATSAPTSRDIQPAISAAPRLANEKAALEAESSTSNVGAPRAETAANQIQGPSRNRETPAEAPRVETPRETPAALSAHEVERAADILRQIRVQLTPQLNEARIQLQPVELGRVSIHLTVEEGRMKTVVRAEKTETLQAIQTHLPELRASLRQHGIDAQEFQLMLGFENRERPRDDKAPTSPNTRASAAEVRASERSASLHAAVAKTGVDFYA